MLHRIQLFAVGFIFVLLFPAWTCGQNLFGGGLGLNQEMLTEVTETGKIHSINHRNRMINITTPKGRKTIELPPPGHNLGFETQISVTGKTDLSFLKRGMAIHVTCKVNKRNKITEPAERIVVFTPNRTTVFGFQDEPLEAEGDIRPVSLIASVSSVKKDKIIARYGNTRNLRRVEIPVNENAEVELNGSNFLFAKPGDEITATGHVIRKPILMAHTINIVRTNPDKKTKDSDPKAVAQKGDKAGKGKGKGKAGKKDVAKGKGKPAKMIAIDDGKDKKRKRTRAGRAFKIN